MENNLQQAKEDYSKQKSISIEYNREIKRNNPATYAYGDTPGILSDYYEKRKNESFNSDKDMKIPTTNGFGDTPGILSDYYEKRKNESFNSDKDMKIPTTNGFGDTPGILSDFYEKRRNESFNSDKDMKVPTTNGFGDTPGILSNFYEKRKIESFDLEKDMKIPTTNGFGDTPGILSDLNEKRKIESFDSDKKQSYFEKHPMSKEDLINLINHPSGIEINNKKQEDPIMQNVIQKNITQSNNRKNDIALVIKKLLGNYTFLNIVDEGLYVYDEKYYRSLNPQNALTFIKSALDNLGNKQFRMTCDYKEIFHQLLIEPDIQLSKHDIQKNEDAIIFNNGTYYVDKEEFKENYFSKEDFAFSKIQYAYNPFEESQNVYTRRFINSISNGSYDLEELLWETIAYIMSNYYKAKAIFVLIGAPNSGKSTIVSFIQSIIGNELCCSISPHDLSGDFSLAELYNKKLCVDADLSNNAMGAAELSLLKKLTSGGNDQMKGNKKFLTPFYFTNECKFLFASNNILSFKTTEDITPILNRLVILPFNHSIPIEEQDPELLDKLLSEKNYCIQMSLEALHRLKDRKFNFNKVVNSNSYISYGYQYQPLINFLNEYCCIGENNEIKSNELYEAFLNYCIETNQEKNLLDLNQVIPYIKKQYNVDSVSNGKYRSLRGIALI